MKGVIKSKAALTYGDAQKILDDASDQSELAKSIKGLNHLARIFRKKRVDSGALTLASTQVPKVFTSFSPIPRLNSPSPMRHIIQQTSPSISLLRQII